MIQCVYCFERDFLLGVRDVQQAGFSPPPSPSTPLELGLRVCLHSRPDPSIESNPSVPDLDPDRSLLLLLKQLPNLGSSSTLLKGTLSSGLPEELNHSI
jgi:hypothetical protein